MKKILVKFIQNKWYEVVFFKLIIFVVFHFLNDEKKHFFLKNQLDCSFAVFKIQAVLYF